CPYRLLLETEAPGDPADHQLRLHVGPVGAGRVGDRGPGEGAEHRVDRPPLPLDGGGGVAGRDLVELEVQGVRRAVEHLAERLRPVAHQQVARVQAVGQGGDGQVDLLAGEDLQRAVDARVAAGVGVEDEHDARGEAAELGDVAGVERRAHGGD